MLDRDRIDRQDKGHAAGEKHAGQGDDEGGHFQIVDDCPHDRAEQRGDHKDKREGGQRMDAGILQENGEENTGESDDRADGQVNAAGQDHEGHANGGNAQKGIVGQQIADDTR